MKLKNKIVMITGASSGIGRACAEAFAAEGANLILLARRIGRIESLAENLHFKYSVQTHCLDCDVQDKNAVALAVESLPDEWKNIDILVNNAGLSRGLNKIYEGVLQDWEEMIDTNVKGLLYVSRAILPAMVQRQSGMVINISSIAGLEVYPNGNVYCATKAAARTISTAMRVDLNGTGIRVVNIDPGLVETEFSEVRFRGDTERAEKIYQGYTPLHAEDVGEAIIFCATRPPHVTIADMLILPTDQASTTIVNKKI